jgi:deazaflavin-dependent oxidoreductase (nitroreductase family)
MSTSPSDFNARIIAEFRANAGVVGPPFAGMELLLLHHRGARSGTARINPLAVQRDGGRYVIFASKAGAPENPAWYYNLLAHPRTTIELGTDTIEVLASEAKGEERDRLFARQTELAPAFADYANKTERVIPVIVLTPVDAV